jgi:hypothetical protein
LRDHRRRRVAFVVAGGGPRGVGGLVHDRHASKVYGGSLLWEEVGERAKREAIGSWVGFDVMGLMRLVPARD